MPEINVALIGHHFMGKAHSNAYRQVRQVFPGQSRSAHEGACAERPARKNWKKPRGSSAGKSRIASGSGWWNARISTWSMSPRPAICTIPWSLPRPRPASTHLREAACQHPGGSQRDAEGGGKGRRDAHGQLQLSPRARRRLRQEADRGGPDRARSTIITAPICRTGSWTRISRWSGGWKRNMRAAAPWGTSARTPRTWPNILNGEIQIGDRPDDDLHQGAASARHEAKAPGEPKARKAKGKVTVDDDANFLARFKNGSVGFSSRRDSPAAAGITTPSRFTAAKEALPSTWSA